MINRRIYNTIDLPRKRGEGVSPMNIAYYRPSKSGPEAILETIVTENLDSIIGVDDDIWAGASPQIGAGLPDILVASFRPEIVVLSQIKMPNANILAYLRAVGKVKLDTITNRLNLPRELIIRSLNGLIEYDVVSQGVNTFSLSPEWRNILPEIIAIEVKVNKWRRAVDQAARNQIFAHKSYIALPSEVAWKIRDEPFIKKLGIGVLAVQQDQGVKVIRRSRRKNPRVWTYYYEIASLVASYFGNNK